MTSSKLGNDRGMKYRKARSKAIADMAKMAQTDENNETNAPVIGKKDILRALKRLVGVLLIVLAMALGGVLTSMPAYAAYTVVFIYVCVQVLLWWDLFS